MHLCLLHAVQRSPCISVSGNCQSVYYRVPDQPPKPTPVEQLSTSRQNHITKTDFAVNTVVIPQYMRDQKLSLPPHVRTSEVFVS